MMSILIVQKSAPYGSSNAKEALDIALAAGTFDQEVSLLFTGDACYQLLADQNPKEIDQKNISQMLKALPIYGVENILVDKESLEIRGIKELDKDLNLKQVSKREIKALYQNAKSVLRF